MTFEQQAVALGLVLPASLAGVVRLGWSALASGVGRNADLANQRGWAWGVALGFLVSVLSLDLLTIRFDDPQDGLIILVPALAFLGVLEASWVRERRFRLELWGLRLLVAGFFAWRLTPDWPEPESWADFPFDRTGFLPILALLSLVIWRLDAARVERVGSTPPTSQAVSTPRRRPGGVGWLLTADLALVGVLIQLAGIAKFAQLALAGAAAVFGASLAGWRRDRQTESPESSHPARAATGIVATLRAGLLACAYFNSYSAIPAITYLMAALIVPVGGLVGASLGGGAPRRKPTSEEDHPSPPRSHDTPSLGDVPPSRESRRTWLSSAVPVLLWSMVLGLALAADSGLVESDEAESWE